MCDWHWQVTMGYRKYVKDYSNEYIIKPNGKPGIIAVYKGKYFRFVADEAIISRAKVIFAILSVFSTVACIIPFLYRSVGSHTLYVALPHALCLFPLVHLLMGVYSFCFRTPPFVREYKDKIEGRITAFSITSACCLGATAVAQIVNCAITGFSLPDVLYFVLLLVASAAAGTVFFLRGVLKTEECTAEGTKK